LTETYEVGIVGAGPAGSSCARALGEAGIEVAIFDPSHPREKPCGGVIDSRIPEEFNIPKKLLQKEVKWLLAERYRFTARLVFDPPIFLVSRKDFDYHLLQEALKHKNVKLFDERVKQITKSETGWTLTTDKRSINVKYLVGADGCPSIVRQKVSTPIPNKFLANTVGCNFECPQDYVESNFQKDTVEACYSHKYVQKAGFAWIFPKRASVNVGIGGLVQGRTLMRMFEEFMASHHAAKRLRNMKGQFFAHLIPSVWEKEFYDLPCAGKSWALIGDAAAHVGSISGAGLYYAMKGGVLCASAVLKGDMRLFDRLWREDYGEELYYAAKNFRTFYGSVGLFFWLGFLFDNYLQRVSPRRHSD